MIGAIVGDIVGSRFERYNHKSKDFELFDEWCRPTDDSVMSLAVAQAILESEDELSELSQNAISCMQKLGREYPGAGYGGTFFQWIWAPEPRPYHSYGNGAAMRVGPCGYAARSLDEAKEMSAAVTRVTHDHPDGMRGAEAVSVAIWLARAGEDKEAIREVIARDYYALGFEIDRIRARYRFDVSCKGSVPVAIEAFLESTDFEDAIRTAISVGGDSDTIAAIAGSIAEAYYGVPEAIVQEAVSYLDPQQTQILRRFEKSHPSRALVEGRPHASVYDLIRQEL